MSTVIITKPGRYVTRRGRHVIISSLDGKGSASCSGHLLKPDSLGRVRRHWSIWQPNGRYLFIGEHGRDIVAMVEEPTEGKEISHADDR